MLADLAAGRLAKADACDAHPYLLRAARFHGTPTHRGCPVCRREKLTEVSYVYGDRLGALAGTARTPRQVADLADEVAEFTVYVVEVCRSCGWNHLTTSYLLGSGRGQGRASGRGAPRTAGGRPRS